MNETPFLAMVHLVSFQWSDHFKVIRFALGNTLLGPVYFFAKHSSNVASMMFQSRQTIIASFQLKLAVSSGANVRKASVFPDCV